MMKIMAGYQPPSAGQVLLDGKPVAFNRPGSTSSARCLLWELAAMAAGIVGGTVLKGGFGPVWAW